MREGKASLRKRIQARLDQLDKESIERKSRLISEALFQCGCWCEADMVLCYLSFDGEVETKWIIDRAFEENKTVGVPRVTGDLLSFYRISDRKHSLAENQWGIKEPGRNLPEIDLRQISGVVGKILIIAPGLAFDRQKNRLGRGKGYYDRFLAAVRESRGRDIFAVALSFREQLVRSVPVSEHDRKLDMIIVENQIIL
ncbi:MAG: 5-formyltetrahydrofolate cyclo-ligase [Omnitrophica bacterium]|nr:5-formyltetrahydrofolate cyclo-ligase [Candidatus Omnitrophota bacterium]